MNFSKTTYKTLLCGVLLLGLLAYVLRFTYFNDDGYKVIQEILCTIGNILIVGVAVGFFTTIVQNLGLFKEELGNVIYAKDFLANRKDIDQIWLNVSKAVFEEKFPEIQDHFFERMQEYLQCEDVSYYNNYEMHIMIERDQCNRDLINVSKKISFELVATSKAKQYYKYKTWTTVAPNDEYSCTIEAKIDGKNPKRRFLKLSKGDDLEGKWEQLRIKLSGRDKYRVDILEQKIYNINSDHTISFRAKHITNNLRVQIIHPKDIKVTFCPSGTQLNFREVNNTETINEMCYDDVLLPKQGYVIALYCE